MSDDIFGKADELRAGGFLDRKEDLPSGEDADLDVGMAQFLAAEMAKPKPTDYYDPLRTAAQGATMGFADEIFAGLQYPFSDQTYGELLEEERSKLKQSYSDNLITSAATEFGGAVIPSLAFRGMNLPLTLGGIGANMAKGFVGGGVYGFGSGEGDLQNRAVNAGVNAGVGAVAAPLVSAAGGALKAGAEAGIKGVGRLFGGKTAAAVEAEIQRIANETGMTVDEIVARVKNGEIIAEMTPSTRSVARGYFAGGGKPQTTLNDAIEPRVSSQREKALDKLKGALGGSKGENVLMTTGKTMDDLKALETQAYKAIYKTNPVIAPREQNTIRSILSNDPDILSDSAAAFKTATGRRAPFEVSSNGKVKFTRNLSLEEAEVIRRILNDKANKAFRDGNGTAGEAIREVEKRLRSRLDESVPELAVTRQRWSSMKKQKDAFDKGTTALNKTSDQVQQEIARLSPEELAMYRRGLAVSIDRSSELASRRTLPAKISDMDAKENKIIDMVLPSGTRDDIFDEMLRATNAWKANNEVLKGSSTAVAMAQQGRQGADGAISDLATMAIDPQGGLHAGARLVKRFTDSLVKGMPEKQREQVVNILISENPDLVRRALTDQSAQNQLISAIRRTAVGMSGLPATTIPPFANDLGIGEGLK